MPDIQNHRCLYDFLNALRAVDMPLVADREAIIEDKILQNGSPPTPKELLESYQNHLQTTRALSTKGGSHSAFATLQGEGPDGKAQPHTHGDGEKRLCLCGEDQSFRKCPNIVPELRTPGWVHDKEVQKQVDEKTPTILPSMASSSKQINPTEYDGYEQNPRKPQRGLLHESFNSPCPPVVTPNTTIIAVCGPNDYQGNANHDCDGWFFSDFYLFHHLFRHTAQKQYWLTCVSPKELVKKYKQFVHGDPRKDDRRIVLDAGFAKEVEDVIVFQPRDLLERFLAYTTNACKDTRGTDAPILILIFGHGKATNFGITIGGAGDWDSCDTLRQDQFKEAIYRHNPNPNVALLTTACYGGGWTQTTFLNITAMAGVNTEEELLSWPQSTSMGRCCGSRYASGVAQALIRLELQNLDEASEQDICQSPTFAALVATIHDILRKEIDVRENNDISFSAKDDMWEMELRARTGFPLETYLKKWESLAIVPQGASSGQSLSASIRFSDTSRLGIPEAEFRLKRLAFDYLKSYPGDDSAPKNHVIHPTCRQLLLGETVPKERLELVAGALQYRLTKVMARATAYKDRLNITFPDCHDCDLDFYLAKLRKDFAKQSVHLEIKAMLGRAELFDDPQEHEGMPYYKGERYLNILLTESGWSLERIEDALSELNRVKLETSPIEATLRTFRFWEVPELRDMVGTLAKSFKKRLRSRSPAKRPRKSLEGVFPDPGGFRERSGY